MVPKIARGHQTNCAAATWLRRAVAARSCREKNSRESVSGTNCDGAPHGYERVGGVGEEVLVRSLSMLHCARASYGDERTMRRIQGSWLSAATQIT
eukprot:352917-Chlamydomonas_euryale.AAC.10